MNKNYISLLAAGLFVGAQAMAVPTNITIADKAPDFNGFTGNGSTSAAGSTSIAGGSGLATNNNREDNETERVGSFASIAGQQWDMEGFILDADAKKLFIVAGYDLLNGLHGGRPGDLFIKVGGAEPTGAPTTNTNLIQNGIASSGYTSPYNYSYAVDLSLKNSYTGGTYGTNVASFGSSVTVYDLNAATTLNTTLNDTFRSNPWKFSNVSGNSVDASYGTGVSYTTGLANPFGQGFQGTSHNVLEIDISFLGTIAAGTNVWFSYTMECGNDSLKGFTNAGFRQVPDASMSALMISLGLAALSFVGFKRRRA